MVIKTEYGNVDNIPEKTQIRRDVLKSQIPQITEDFLQHNMYRWGRMYELSGTKRKLIRQF